MLVGILVNIAILLCYFWKLLSTEKDEEMVIAVSEMFVEDDVNSHRFSPATMSHLNSINSPEWSSAVDAIAQSSSLTNYPGHIEETLTLSNHISSPEADIHSVAGSGAESPAVSNAPGEVVGGAGNSKRKDDAVVMRRHVRSSNQTNSLRAGSTVQTLDEKEGPIERWKHLVWKTCVYLVTIGMLISLLMGLNMSWSAITAALVLIVLDFKDARPCLEKVSYSLLIFFCGMFITVDGFNKTGIPSALWDFMEPYARINSAGEVAVLALVILFLSNVASNVPTGCLEEDTSFTAFVFDSEDFSTTKRAE